MRTAETSALKVLPQTIRSHSADPRPGEAAHWPERAPVLAHLLREADADVVGAQEVLASQLPVLDEALGATHERLGIGREGGGRGEHNLLFLRRERFEVRDWDQFWLSEQPALIGEIDETGALSGTATEQIRTTLDSYKKQVSAQWKA